MVDSSCGTRMNQPFRVQPSSGDGDDWGMAYYGFNHITRISFDDRECNGNIMGNIY